MITAYGHIFTTAKSNGRVRHTEVVEASSWSEAASMLVELEGKSGEILRIGDHKGNIFIEFFAYHEGHRIWWEEPALEWGMLIAAICQEREK